MPLQATSGAASYDAFGGGVAVVPAYIEEVFSTYLYKGDGVSNADFVINNGLDLDGEGGLVWIKRRDITENHALTHTGQTLNANGFYPYLQQGAGGITANDAYGINAFTTTGLTLRGRSGPTANEFNSVGSSMASWSFRKKPKFFDIQTWTGTGSNRTISHSLGSVPACIIVKRTDTTGDWQVYHRSLANTEYLVLNSTAAKATGATRWNSTTPTSSVFSLGTDASVNASGGTYVAYLFAHDAGGFGLTGTDNVISCGSFSGNTTVNLGYEPQWVLLKSYDAVDAWYINDNMRGWTNDGANGNDAYLRPNSNGAEVTGNSGGFPTATGFTTYGFGGTNGIYIAIRRGPMKVPTTGTTVFSPNVPTAFTQFTTGFPVDLGMWNYRTGYAENTVVNDRLRGVSTLNVSAFPNNLVTATTAAEAASQGTQNWNNTGLYAGTSGAVFYSFGRAPSFFDEVCYTGTGSARTVSHNLAAVPELMIVKRRDTAALWVVYSSATGNTNYLSLNGSSGSSSDSGTFWNSTTPTSSVFSVNTGSQVNGSSATFVAYLFATCAGVSKVGSYTGTGTTKQIDCGFTAGARFVLIKKTSGTGSWYVWDSARGIVSGNDPYLLLNSTAAEVTNTDYIDTYSAGFEISSTAPSEINENGGSFIFLAIS
jgi:hypothetical protein